MNRLFLCLPAALALAGSAYAQSSQDAVCPQLPPDSGLAWQHKSNKTSDFCRALRADGSEAFGLFITNDSPFKPSRSNRAEQSSMDGREIQWYRTEIGTQPNLQARETVIELPGGRVAHVWVHANSEPQLAEALGQASQLRFSTTQLSSN